MGTRKRIQKESVDKINGLSGEAKRKELLKQIKRRADDDGLDPHTACEEISELIDMCAD